MKKIIPEGLAHKTRNVVRWSTTEAQVKENVAEHSYEVCILTTFLYDLIKEIKPSVQLNIETLLRKAMWHDVAEVLTTDLPSGLKKRNKEIKKAWDELELEAENLFLKDKQIDLTKEEHQVFKLADNLAALLWTIKQLKLYTNTEFSFPCIKMKEVVNNGCNDLKVLLKLNNKQSKVFTESVSYLISNYHNSVSDVFKIKEEDYKL